MSQFDTFRSGPPSLEGVLAQVEQRYKELGLSERVKDIRACIAEATKQVNEQAKIDKITDSNVLEKKYDSAARKAFASKGITLLGKGMQAHVIGLREGHTNLALKVFMLPGEGIESGNWENALADLTLDDVDMESGAHKQAVCLELISDMPSVAKLVAFSEADKTVAMEYIPGDDASNVNFLMEDPAVVEPKIHDFINTVMTGWKRGISMDNKIDNVRVTPDLDLKVVDFFGWQQKNDEKELRLTTALALIQQVVKHLFANDQARIHAALSAAVDAMGDDELAEKARTEMVPKTATL